MGRASCCGAGEYDLVRLHSVIYVTRGTVSWPFAVRTMSQIAEACMVVTRHVVSPCRRYIGCTWIDPSGGLLASQPSCCSLRISVCTFVLCLIYCSRLFLQGADIFCAGVSRKNAGYFLRWCNQRTAAFSHWEYQCRGQRATAICSMLQSAGCSLIDVQGSGMWRFLQCKACF